MTNPTFDEAMNELLRESEAHKPSDVIMQSVLSVLQNPCKLFCWVGNVSSAIGAARIEPGLYASDLFVKLLCAYRALDWEVVAVILEQAKPPPESASVTGVSYERLAALLAPGGLRD